MLCKKCVLSEYKPDIWLNEEGVCNICVDFEKQKTAISTPGILESELVKILEKHKGKNKYDCLVMCSGGKDSTLSLYYMKKRYRMNTLAFTFDHGYENNEAVINIRNAVDILGVDWLYFKSDYMKGVFRKIITTKSAAPICHVCAIWYMQLVYNIASQYNIPIIVAGWTKGQATEGAECAKEYCSMSSATKDFIIRHLRCDAAYKDFPLSMKEAVKGADKKSRITAVSPHWFLQYDPYKAMEILQKELKWIAPSMSYPLNSTNCMMNFASVYLTMKHFGYTHYHIEMSKLIRKGELAREDALRLLEINFDKGFVNSILKKLDCSWEE
jgi:tRNA(Ile)-lysidine synthase TilS/MesJ